MTSTTLGTAAPGSRQRPLARLIARLRRHTRLILLLNLAGQIGIILTGGVVRLTGSGLGCSSWPLCEPGQFTPVRHMASSIHPYIEFGNRTLTGVLLVIAALVAAVVWTAPGRSASYRGWGWAPLGGVLAQAVIGGISVLLKLNPAVVGFHLIISMALVAASAYLVRREREGDAPALPVVSRLSLRLGAAVGVLLVPVLVLGVVVTGSGPHSGDDTQGYRFSLDPARMTQAHSGAVWLFLIALAALSWTALRQSDTPSGLRRALLSTWIVVIVQGAVGYLQYFTGLPAALVAVHMLLAAILTAATTLTLLHLRTRNGNDLGSQPN